MIFSALKKLFTPDNYKTSAHEAYVSLVKQARTPFFYEECAVSDTLDGRFDMIVLHVFLLSNRLKAEEPKFVRALWEVFFSDMDRSMREMGASDTGIGKRIKKMVQAFYGRIDSYEKSLVNAESLKESLQRNLYRGVAVADSQISLLMNYINRNLEHLKAQDTALLRSGNVSFCDA